MIGLFTQGCGKTTHVSLHLPKGGHISLSTYQMVKQIFNTIMLFQDYRASQVGLFQTAHS